MPSVNIESFTKLHLLQAEKFLRENPDIFSLTDITQFKDDLNEYLAIKRHTEKDGLTLVITENNILYGVIMYGKDSNSHNAYNIKWLVVKKDQQNKGYGSYLIDEVFKRVRNAGGKHVYLETSNERHNEYAKMFYEHHGFKKVGVLPDYYDPPIQFPRKLEDGIIYHKAL